MELDQDMYDDNYDGTARTNQPESTAIAATEAGVPQSRDNALHLRGTDDMSTADVHKYLALFTTDSKPRIEWIDDSSLNLVYYTADDAKIALAHLTQVPTDQVDSSTSQPAQSNPEKPDARLAIRFATTADKKEKGAKDRSRWYLFHPEDDPDSRPPRHPRRRREEPYSKTGRHERRAGAGNADLFASKLPLDASHLPPLEMKPDLFDGERKKSGEDSFTKRLREAEKSAPRQSGKKSDRSELDANDLFSRISGTRAQPKGQDLFANRLASLTGGDLAARISTAGGPIRSNKGLAIKGASNRARASDLF